MRFRNDNLGGRATGSVVSEATYVALLNQGQRSGRWGFGPAQGAYILATENWATVNFSGLTVGNTYQVQIWASDNVGDVQNVVLVVGDGSTGLPLTSDTHIYHEMADGGAGQYGIGTFEANATTQSFNIRQRNNLTTTATWSNDAERIFGLDPTDLGSSNPLTTSVQRRQGLGLQFALPVKPFGGGLRPSLVLESQT